MMQEPKEQSLLLQEVTRQLLILEDAIANVNQTRKQLKLRSVEMKSDIQTSVSRQLDALKRHEASLLKQVDLIQQAKDAALQGQEDKLHEALGALTVAVQLEEGQSATPVKDVLQRLKSLRVNPTETPTLSLKSDFMHADSESSNYGGLQFGGMFNLDASSASLPRPFEDYGDDEHHVLYRSIAESTGDRNREISVMVPRLSQKPEDWLFMPAEDLTPSRPTTGSSRFLFPPFMSGGLKERLEKHDDMSRVSIHQWLCDIQGQTDVEEEEADFDVLSSSAFLVTASSKDSSIEVLGADEATPVFTVGSLQTSTTSLNTAVPSLVSSTIQLSQNSTPSYFSQVMSAPTNSWLLSGQEVPPQTSAVYCHEVLRYFHEVSNDTRMWLQKYTEEKQREVHSPNDENDLSGMFVLKSKSDGPVTKVQTDGSDYNVWLMKEITSECEEKASGEKVIVADDDGLGIVCAAVSKDKAADNEQEGTVCNASDVCMTAVQGAPDLACSFSEFEKCKSSRCLAGSETTQKEAQSERAVGSYFDLVLRQNVADWLLADDRVSIKEVPPTVGQNEPFPTLDFAPFTSGSSADDCWLLQSTKSRVPPCSSGDDLPSPAGDQWLVSSAESSDYLLPLEESWRSRFTHDQSTSTGNEDATSTDNSYSVEHSLQMSNCDWLFQSESKSSLSRDEQSEWLHSDCCVRVDPTPDQVWISVPDGSPSSKDFNSHKYCDNLFRCFRQIDEDAKSWLLNAAVVVE